MSKYFSNFPIIDYNLPPLGRTTTVTDVTKRFILRDFYRRNFLRFYQYDVIDGERPDNVAYKFYGESELDWIVLMPNEILDPYFQWPRSQLELNSYIRSKYGGISDAQSKVHHYEQIIQQRGAIQNEDGETIVIPEKTLIVDQTTYVSLSPSDRRAITNYDYEVARNERYRTISIVDPIYIPSIVETFRNLYA